MSLINNSTILPFQALTTAWHLWKVKAFEFYGRELTCTNRPVLFCPDLKALWHCSSYPLLNKSKCQGCHHFLAKKTKWLYNSALHIGREQSYLRHSEWFVLQSLAICLEIPLRHCQSLTDHNRLQSRGHQSALLPPRAHLQRNASNHSAHYAGLPCWV